MKRISVRLSDEDYDYLHELIQHGTFLNMSDALRAMIRRCRGR